MVAIGADEAAARAELTGQLLRAGHYIETGVEGLFGLGAMFEQVTRAFRRLIHRQATTDGASEVTFPPVVNREILRVSGYMENFPDLCGSVHSFCGDDAAHRALIERVIEGGDWSEHLSPTAVTLTPAGCYPLYATQRGDLPEGGRTFDLCAWVFRHEPSDDPARLQMFRMHENVRLGAPDDVYAWRETWRGRAMDLMHELGLDVRMEVASDPFFGRGGRLMKATQREQMLKFEILVPICSVDEPTAIASFNYHQDKFSVPFGIRTATGEVAHTACLGFGLERIAVALLKTHGMDIADWPAPVRERLLS